MFLLGILLAVVGIILIGVMIFCFISCDNE